MLKMLMYRKVLGKVQRNYSPPQFLCDVYRQEVSSSILRINVMSMKQFVWHFLIKSPVEGLIGDRVRCAYK